MAGIGGIVRGQPVQKAKVQRARELRRNATAEEGLLWQLLRGDRLAGLHFRRQQVIDGFIVDFYCHAARLVVEIDGSVHDAPEVAGVDQERDAILAAKGLMVLHIPVDEVRSNIFGVLNLIARRAKARS